MSQTQNLAVHCPTQESYDRLMQAYEKKGWRWCDNSLPTSLKNWKYYREKTRVKFEDRFSYGDDKDFNDRTIILVDEAIKRLTEPVPFEPGKNARELGIDTSRKFVVVGGGYFNKGDIVVLAQGDNLILPFFKRLSDGLVLEKRWENLAYYDEPETNNTVQLTDDWHQAMVDNEEQQFLNKMLNMQLEQLYLSLHKPYYINPKSPSFMSKATQFLRNLTLSADDKLLRRMGLEDETGQPTQEGYDLSDEISYRRNRLEIIQLAEKMEAEEQE